MLKRLLDISRPRFWLYVWGPFLIGYCSGDIIVNRYSLPFAILWGLFFLLPANLFIYGINDVYDYDTDLHNTKKGTKEALVVPREHRALLCIAGCVALLALGLSVYTFFLGYATWGIFLGIILFLFLGWAYSSPPIRAKSIPVLDSMTNFLYVAPAIVGYSLAGGVFPEWWVLAAAWCWCMAMHAYSAVPDIEADRKAGVRTIATLCTHTYTLLLCFILYLISTVLVALYYPIITPFGVLYCCLMMVSLYLPKEKLISLYWIFPLINMVVGVFLWLATFLA